jgi:Carboxypeptidase regulatory-like domain
MKKISLSMLALLALIFNLRMFSQSLGNAGTVTGTVTDASGAAIANAAVEILNPNTGYTQQTKSDSTGAFHLGNLPPNAYRLSVSSPKFVTLQQAVEVRSSVPIQLKLILQVAGTTQTVEVSANAALVEDDPSAHSDVDRSTLLKLPTSSPGSGLSDAITYSTGGVASDANGFFHPMGDHAQVSFVIDGQPIGDQQSKVFSTQFPVNAIQSMELVTGAPSAEFGDKSSLVVNTVTRSGLGAPRTFGSLDANYGSFGTAGGSATLGFGNTKYGNFLSLNGIRSGRFLDTPEFQRIHDIGNNETIFDRFDYQPNGTNVFHLNLFVARNWIQIPNSYDQLTQDQKQRVTTWNIAPGYQHTFNAHTLLTINPFVRQDHFIYYPSRDPLQDTPFTSGQNRHLTNYGVKGDLAIVHGRHDMKFGTQLQQTRLVEKFGFAVTDSNYNPVCVDADGNPEALPGVTDPNACAGLGFTANPNLQPGLVPYDLTRGGTPFNFYGKANINQYAFYAQDLIHLGNFTINAGLRFDQYNGLVSSHGLQPRLGIAYALKPTNTVLRVAYSRTFETPFNENLILSSYTGAGGLAQNVFGGAGVSPIRPGFRNQFNTGFQQAIGRWILVDADYFWKYTHNAYDFSILLNTTITFPISWKNSKLDGFAAKVSTIDIHGFQAYMTMGHTRARYFPGQNGGILPNEDLVSVFRIDHDQAFQQTTNLRYQRPHNTEWIAFTWRFDRGLVVSGVPDSDAALGLTPNQQTTIGLSCGSTFATPTQPISSCNTVLKSTLITLPPAGTEDDDHNPDRVKSRNIFNLGVGTDNLLHHEGPTRIVASFIVTNLTNKVALYNFLSTFSGTHFLEPRSYQAHLGFVF